jgi:hypothetical protein
VNCFTAAEIVAVSSPGKRLCPNRVNRVVSAMLAVSPFCPEEPTSLVRSATSEKCQWATSCLAVQISPVSIPDFGRDLVKRFRWPGGHETFASLDEATFPAREDRLKPTPDNYAGRSNAKSGKNTANTPEIGGRQ